jgi:hypothetical protein
VLLLTRKIVIVEKRMRQQDFVSKKERTLATTIQVSYLPFLWGDENMFRAMDMRDSIRTPLSVLSAQFPSSNPLHPIHPPPTYHSMYFKP